MKSGTSLVISLFAALSAVAWYVPEWSEWLALGLMIFAGIPHGSFDLRVAEAKWREGTVSRKALLVVYLSCVLAMSGLCVFAPFVGLLLFLVISAVHFAEGEAHSRVPPNVVQGFLFGVGAILLPIGLHLTEVQPYLSYFISEEVFTAAQASLSAGSVLLAVIMGAVLTKDMLWKTGIRDADTIERVVCLCGWIALPPLAGFAVWFIGRHSRQHLEVCKDMFSTKGFGIPLDFAVISLLAVGGLAPFALLFDFSEIHQIFAASLCLIAGLTLPHMIVSHGIREVVKGNTRPSVRHS
jgi:Brp/Blh family beta-carotene 15,15'-monooxygenase